MSQSSLVLIELVTGKRTDSVSARSGSKN